MRMVLLWKNLQAAALAVTLYVNGCAAAGWAKRSAQTPMQIRLAYAGETGMMVSWNTYDKIAKPSVQYGLSANKLDHTASSHVSVTYNTSTTYSNHVKLTGLTPGTLYYYRPCYGSKTYNFTTSRPVTNHEPFVAAVVVDLGTMGDLGLSHHVGTGAANPLTKGEINTIQSLYMHKDQYDFVWHPGDIAYADYWLKEEIQGYLPNTTIHDGYMVYEKILNRFFDEMTKITTTKPYMVGPGNHEANCDNGGTTNPNTNVSYTWKICAPGQQNFTGYRNHWRMPSAESGGVENFWYSFDHGMTHFIQLDTETDLGHGFISPDAPGGVAQEHSGPFSQIKNAQTNWLAADLAAVNRTKTPWIIVSGHRPWYINLAFDPSDVCRDCEDVFEPLFNQYKVDLVLSGHVHAYQRNAPIANNTVDPNGLNNPEFPWYITNGAAGHYDGLDTLSTPPKHYSRFALDTTYGWSRLTFHNCSHLTHEFVASGNGTVLDTATLFKDRVC